MRDVTVLLSASGSPTIPGMIKCFRTNGERKIRIIGVDMSDDPTCRFLVDSFYKVPAVTDSSYCSVLLDICKHEHVDIYFPNISEEVSALVEYQHDFANAGIRLSMPNPESIRIANDKLLTYRTLKNAGIPVPDFVEIKTVEDFKNGCVALGYPDKALCIKIVSGSGSRGVRIIDNKKSRYEIFAHEKPNTFFTSYEDILSILEGAEHLDDMLLMPYLPGNEYTVDLLADHGTILYQIGRENVVSLMSIAQESVLVKNDYAYDVSQRVIKLLNYDGNCGFDFMKDENGIPVLTDINPRITATVSVVAAGGVNLPYLRVKQILGERLPQCKVTYGTRLRRRYSEYFADSNGNYIPW